MEHPVVTPGYPGLVDTNLISWSTKHFFSRKATVQNQFCFVDFSFQGRSFSINYLDISFPNTKNTATSIPSSFLFFFLSQVEKFGKFSRVPNNFARTISFFSSSYFSSFIIENFRERSSFSFLLLFWTVIPSTMFPSLKLFSLNVWTKLIAVHLFYNDTLP